MVDLQNQLRQTKTAMQEKQAKSFSGSSKDPFTSATAFRDNYQTYPYDYFAGTDCKIFFGDVWVDDIITIQYNVTQSKVPIYGYASQNFDAIAKGQVIVEGNLAIAFKETGYLNIIQALIDSQRKNKAEAVQRKLKSYSDELQDKQEFVPGLTTINEDGTKVEAVYNLDGTPNFIRQGQTIEQILSSKKISTSLSQDMGFDRENRDFEDFAEILEDSIWGDQNGKQLTLLNKIKRADEFDYHETNGGIITAKGRSYANVLNIMLTFGDINDYRAEHTVIILNDVHFTSNSLIVAPTGDPIGEMYTFIARDINDSITSSNSVIRLNPVKLSVRTDSKLSKYEDIEKLENFLDDKQGTYVTVATEASFLRNNGWKPLNKVISKLSFSYNKVTPFIDQLSSFVENVINAKVTDTDPVNLSRYSQLIVATTFGNLNGNTTIPDEKITMILEQRIPDTYTFKVISPTRTGFKATNLLSREDLFWGKPPSAPKQESLTPKEREKNKIKEVETKQEPAPNYSLSIFEENSAEARNEAEALKQVEQIANTEKKNIVPKASDMTSDGSETGVAITGTTITHFTRADEHPLSAGKSNYVFADISNIIKKNNITKTAGYAPAAFGGEVYSIGKESFSIRTNQGVVRYAHIPSSYTKNLKVGQKIEIGTRVDYINDHYHLQSEKKFYSPVMFEKTIRRNLGIGYRNTTPTPYGYNYGNEVKPNPPYVPPKIKNLPRDEMVETLKMQTNKNYTTPESTPNIYKLNQDYQAAKETQYPKNIWSE
jgi:hypothetical protein